MRKKTLRSYVFFVFLSAVLFSSAPALAQQGKTDYYRGLDLYHQRDYEGARKAFQEHLKHVPDDPAAKRWLEKALREIAKETGRPIEAESFGEVAAPAGRSPSNDYERGIAFYRGGEYAQAIQSFRSHLKKKPRHIPTQQWIALVEAHLSAKGVSQFMIEQLPAGSAGSLQAGAAIPPGAGQAGPAGGITQIQQRFIEELHSKENALKTAQVKLDQAQTELERVRRKLAIRTQQVARSIRQTKRAIAQTAEAERVSRALADQMNALGYAHDRFTDELQSKSGELKDAQAKLQDAQNELERLRNESEAVSEARAETESRLADVMKDRNVRFAHQMKAVRYARKRFADELGAKQKALEEVESRAADLRTQLENTRRSLDRKANDAAGVEKAMIETEKSLKGIADSKEKMSSVIGTLRSTQERLAADLREKEAALEASQANEAKLKREIEETREALNRKSGDRAALQNELLKSKLALAEAAEENKKLSASVETLSSTQSRLERDLEARELALKSTAGREADLASDLETVQRDRGTKSADVQQLRRTLQAVETQLQEAEAARGRMAETVEGLRATQDRLTRELEAKEGVIRAAQENLSRTQSELQRVLQSAQVKEKELVSRLEEARQALLKQTQETSNVQKALLETERKLAEAGENRSALAAEVTQLKQTEERLMAEVKRQQDELAVARVNFASGKEAYQTRLDEANRALAETEKSLEQVGRYYQMSEASRLDIEKRLGGAAQDLRSKEQALRTAQGKEQEYISQLDTARKALTQKTADASRIEKSRIEAEGRLAQALSEKEAISSAAAKGEAQRGELEQRVQDLASRLGSVQAALFAKEKEFAGVQAQAAEVLQKALAAQEARAAAESRLAALESKIRGLEETLGQTERALGQVSKNFQLSEDQRGEAEKRLARAEAERGRLAEEINALRANEGRLAEESARREAQLGEMRAEMAKQKNSYEARLAESGAAAADLRRSLDGVTVHYQASENARLDAERRVLELLNGQNTLKAELGRMNDARRELSQEIEAARARLAELQDRGARLEAEASRESEARRQLESQIVLASRREADARAQVENLKQQISRTLPDLQNAMRALAVQTASEDATGGGAAE